MVDRLEKLAPRAAGLAEVEVLETKEVDSRPMDGPLRLYVHFRIVRATGVTANVIHIVKAPGGNSPPPRRDFKPHGPVTIDTFKTGERYWVAFSSQYDFQRCPQGVVGSWPIKEAPKLLEEAVRADLYVHRPEFHPESGLTHSYRAEKDKQSWLVRLERDGKLLWEVKLPGEKYKGDYDGEWRILHRKQWVLEHLDQNQSGYFLFAETMARLEKSNPYGLPAEKHRLTYALDADSGQTSALWVSRLDLSPTATPTATHYFDQKSGAVRREERYDSLASGGKAAGADQERWYRKVVRTYDPVSRKLKSEESFRHTTSPEGSKFVPVSKQ